MSKQTASEIESERLRKCNELRKIQDEAYAKRMELLRQSGLKRLGT
jgi:hypothetical protein